MNDASAQILKGGGVAAGTMGGGVYIVYAQTVIGSFGVLAAAVLSVVLTVKAIKDMKASRILKQAALDDISYRQEHDLPCRRCNDKEEKTNA